MATGFDNTLNPPFSVVQPARQLCPFVFNSPHSGRNYTPQFLAGVQLDRATIRRSEDYRIDELFAGAIAHGCPMLVANFPRAFVDVNREPFELDPAMFADTLPDYVNTRSVRVAGGLGTVPRIVSETEEIYARKIPFAEALERIETVYRPYHNCLRNMLAATHLAFGHAILIDCHSMPSSRDSSKRRMRPDIVLGDRYGTSCAQDIIWAAGEILSELGYDVEINKPYAGGFITEHYGRPESGLHALQVEINRGIYMDETRLTKRTEFERIADDLTQFIARLVALPAEGREGELPLAAE